MIIAEGIAAAGSWVAGGHRGIATIRRLRGSKGHAGASGQARRITVSGLDSPLRVGTVNVHTSGGGISAERVRGSASLSTSGGSIDASDSTGDLDVNTSGGGIRIVDDDGKVAAHTSGGSIRAELHTNHGINLDTCGGSITLLLPQGTHASIDAGTSGGEVTSNLPFTTTGAVSGNHLHGTIGGGGPAIYLHTSGGSIRIGPES